MIFKRNKSNNNKSKQNLQSR